MAIFGTVAGAIDISFKLSHLGQTLTAFPRPHTQNLKMAASETSITIMINDLGNLDKLTLKIQVGHKSNWSNEAVRCTLRSKFMCDLALALKAIPINGPPSFFFGIMAGPAMIMAIAGTITHP
ncbi:hypothetical protein B0H65DRAFT_442089 [Neurospora tetraspora]|uniref:Uncharacterized protein n=1 Tax=Neurospora tetraspora TaxID=94610 RepID=A0AAE0MSF9_9PEZI|nr:hypothetical protein B0H65DRAFT_442089 [Neurospora tetraspora]